MKDPIERAERCGFIVSVIVYIVIFFALGVLMLGACARIEARDPAFAEVEIPPTSGNGVFLWLDPVTGCEYLKSTNGGFIPRYDRSNGYHNTIKGCRA